MVSTNIAKHLYLICWLFHCCPHIRIFRAKNLAISSILYNFASDWHWSARTRRQRTLRNRNSVKRFCRLWPPKRRTFHETNRLYPSTDETDDDRYIHEYSVAISAYLGTTGILRPRRRDKHTGDAPRYFFFPLWHTNNAGSPAIYCPWTKMNQSHPLPKPRNGVTLHAKRKKELYNL